MGGDRVTGGRCMVITPVLHSDARDCDPNGAGCVACKPRPQRLLGVWRAGHDPNDWEIGKRRGLEVLNIMNKDASMNEAAGGAHRGGGVAAGGWRVQGAD